MPLIAYPGTLPGPSVPSVLQAAERRMASDLDGPQQMRGLQRDYLAVQRLVWNVLTDDEKTSWFRWWRDTLSRGGNWFAAPGWPAPSGVAANARRFQGSPAITELPGKLWRITAQCQVRGRGLPPTIAPTLNLGPWRFRGPTNDTTPTSGFTFPTAMAAAVARLASWPSDYTAGHPGVCATTGWYFIATGTQVPPSDDYIIGVGLNSLQVEYLCNGAGQPGSVDNVSYGL